MVYLSRIYTKSGDTGETSLGNGSRVAKDHPRVAVIGTVDELNATLGLALAQCPDCAESALLLQLQNELFDVGADLCVPITDGEEPGQCLRITANQVQRLEHAIDRLNTTLQPLQSFILPGGSLAAAWLHVARTVCRRAERELVTLIHQPGESINPAVLTYLNRLSDLLFVLARNANHSGQNDVLWVPGRDRLS